MIKEIVYLSMPTYTLILSVIIMKRSAKKNDIISQHSQHWLMNFSNMIKMQSEMWHMVRGCAKQIRLTCYSIT